MIRIKQAQPVRGYQIPSVGFREIRSEETFKKNSVLGKALLRYFPAICIDVEDSDVVEVQNEQKLEEPKTELLVEEPEQEAQVDLIEEDISDEDIAVDDLSSDKEGCADPVESIESTLETFTDKEKLDIWAEETHNIKLKRTKTLENMKKDFLKEFYAK